MVPGADGTGIRGFPPIRSCPWVEFSTVRLAGDSIHRGWSIGLRSTADIFIIRLMRGTFGPGDRVRTMQPAAVMRAAFIPDAEPSAELSTPDLQWREAERAADLAAAGSTVAEDSMAVAVPTEVAAKI